MKRLAPLLAGLAVLGLVLVWAFSKKPEAPVPAVLAHYAEYPRLVKAAWTGDRSLAGVVARDLTGGPEGDHDDPVTASGQDLVGGALGFVGFAEDVDELTEAVAAAAAGCGACHAALDVMAPPRPAWEHATAAEWLAWGLVWGDDAAPQAGDAPLDQVVRAYFDDVAAETGRVSGEREQLVRVAHAWAACASCHQTETELPSQ